jgi:peptidoglycan/LPS O-acetylase OafA/YrhL
MARGLAALAVLVYHVRYRFFLDYADVRNPDVAAIAWYFVSAFGHDAVMVFFVLSGYLIGASVIRARRMGRWNVREYVITRGVRLSVVLIPGLILTAVWDRLGLVLFGQAPIYTGVPQSFIHDFFDVASRSTFVTLVGNLCYAQTILVPPFGSNDALWSLAFEGWYYVIFPLLVVCIVPSQPLMARVSAAAAAAVIAYFVGPTIVRYMTFWLLGVGVALLPTMLWGTRWPRLTAGVAAVACVALIGLGHLGRIRASIGGTLFAADALTAISFAACLYALRHDTRPARSGWYARVAAVIAGTSFTLYLVHLPVLVFLRAALNPGRSWEPSGPLMGAAIGIGVGVWAYAWGIAQLTEAHTPRVRTMLLRWFAGDTHSMIGRTVS